MSFVHGEPLLISSSGPDNSIKMWFFEPGLTQPRLLKERCGHSGAPHLLRFYGGQDESEGTSSRHIISAAQDGYLRDISLLNEFQSMNFSKKNLGRNSVKREDGEDIGQVNQFAYSEFRENDWSNMLTSHDKARSPFLWQYADHAMSKVAVQTREQGVQVSAVCVT
jgi:U3 small nucleolar RNA-associated protein 21